MEADYITDIEPFDESSVERESTKGANFEYTCVKPKALPEASITWYRDGQEIRKCMIPNTEKIMKSLQAYHVSRQLLLEINLI